MGGGGCATNAQRPLEVQQNLIVQNMFGQTNTSRIYSTKLLRI